MIIRSASEIYLDANATTPVLPEAAQEAHDAMEELFGNPSSSHISGLRARFILESTRDLVREVLAAEGGADCLYQRSYRSDSDGDFFDAL